MSSTFQDFTNWNLGFFFKIEFWFGAAMGVIGDCMFAVSLTISWINYSIQYRAKNISVFFWKISMTFLSDDNIRRLRFSVFLIGTCFWSWQCPGWVSSKESKLQSEKVSRLHRCHVYFLFEGLRLYAGKL